MIAYAAETTTKRNLEYLRATGWRIMLSPKGPRCQKPAGFRYALDNGAWWSFKNGQPFDEEAFRRAVDELWFDADFLVLPDIVEGGLRSLDFSLEWYNKLSTDGLWLLPVQDGMHPDHVAPFMSELGIFVGGSTKFKEETLFDWAELAHKHSSYIHVGRVNTRRRLNLCKQAGVDSFDGSGPSRFQLHAEVMNRERNQGSIQFIR